MLPLCCYASASISLVSRIWNIRQAHFPHFCQRCKLGIVPGRTTHNLESIFLKKKTQQLWMPFVAAFKHRHSVIVTSAIIVGFVIQVVLETAEAFLSPSSLNFVFWCPTLTLSNLCIIYPINRWVGACVYIHKGTCMHCDFMIRGYTAPKLLCPHLLWITIKLCFMHAVVWKFFVLRLYKQ